MVTAVAKVPFPDPVTRLVKVIVGAVTMHDGQVTGFPGEPFPVIGAVTWTVEVVI